MSDLSIAQLHIGGMPASAAAAGAVVAPAAMASAAGPHAPAAGEVGAALDEANRSLVQSGTQLTFVFDDQVHQTLVKIVDSQTRQVVQQIPSEAALAAARALAGDARTGALVDTRA
jgi:flagellar protein FlaG